MIYFKTILDQRIVASILIICMVGLTFGSFLFHPRPAQAALPTIDISHITLQDIWEALKVVWRTAMKKLQGLQLAIASWTKSKTMVEWALGKALNTLLHRLLAQITNNITNWIQNGGEPRFLSMGLDDWISGELDKAGGAFVEHYLGAGWLCEPFDLELKLAFLNVPTFTDEIQCTLSDINDNIDAFYDDFSKGGWASFVALTEPQNNLYGAYLMAQYELGLVEAKAKEDLKQDLANSQGFKSMRECIWYQNEAEKLKGRDSKGNPIGKTVGGKLTDVMGIPDMPDKCNSVAITDYDNPGMTTGGFQGPCVSECTILTPGSTIKTIADKTSTNWLDQINAQIAAATKKAGPLGVYVQAILNALVNRVMTEGVGLLRAGTENDPAGALKEPDYGDLGAATSTPKIVDPGDVMQEQIDANLLVGQLEVLKTELDKLKTNIPIRIANLETALVDPGYYYIALDALSALIATCENNSSAVSWATNKKREVERTISGLNTELSALRNWQQAINDDDIPGAISLVQAFIDEVDAYLKVWEEYGGIMPTKDGAIDPNSGFAIAQNKLNEARNAAMNAVKAILNNFVAITDYSDDFKGLTEATEDASQSVYDEGKALKAYPGDDLSDKAKKIKTEADQFGAVCIGYDAMLEKLEELRKEIEDIDIDINIDVHVD